jgi:anti-anti-sigma regulatory factor
MFYVTADKSKQLVTMTFSRQVDMDEMKSCLDQTECSLAEMEPGFQLLTDLSNLESMDSPCTAYIGQIMDLCNTRGVSAVFRVIPDPKTDLGYTLMSLFHYSQDVRTMTFENLEEAMRSLGSDGAVEGDYTVVA